MTQTTAAKVRERADQLPDLLKRQELADYTGISVQTFARWAVEKSGPRMTKLGGAVRYRKADVLAWLEASAA
ncbi:helix-turn-helix domain-containing protein [Salinibacterium sp. G-O1]|uniref:helix-turn-helix transcriptional regulator n=1 Tax=Salinibacterium sp. G-O1 TaxID=3046208 RepID=UPI0024B9396D|nr:helix-turn-helix domain-containing protein [Salinibacterium sp. G-O1]MDJ0336425.1 helix-turn-helix domain-containing protein [Salinibacterium sp. G-O1]